MHVLACLAALVLSLTPRAEARKLRDPFIGVRPAAMGNAFLALADDKNSFLYNPAGLALVKGINFDLYDVVGAGDSLDTANKLYGTFFDGSGSSSIRPDTQYARVGAYPAFYMPYLGIVAFANHETAVDIQELSGSEVDLYSVTDYGVIVSGAVPLGRSTSLGMSWKWMNRTGVDQTTTPGALLSQLGMDSATFQSSVFNALKTIQGSGSGYGFDVGLLVRPRDVKRGSFGSFALVGTNLAMTLAPAAGGTAVAAPPMAAHIGMGWTRRQSANSEWSIGLDLKNIGATLVLPQMLYGGFQFKYYGVGAQLGLHQGYLSYGLSYDTSFMRIALASVAYELGTTFFQRNCRYYAVQVILGLHEIKFHSPF